MGEVRPPALAFAADFFARYGFGDRWMFWDAQRDRCTAATLTQARDALAEPAC